MYRIFSVNYLESSRSQQVHLARQGQHRYNSTIGADSRQRAINKLLL